MTSVHPNRAAPEEHELVERAKRGDVAAFEALYRATSGRVFALCLRMLSDRVQATEAMQDVFVRVWERLGQFDGTSSFTTWLHRVCINRLLEQRRTDARREARVLPADLTEIPQRSSQDMAGDADTRLDLERLLPRLGDRARTVFVLHDMEGYDYTEIAAMIGVAESTVRVHLHRARKQLVEGLER